MNYGAKDGPEPTVRVFQPKDILLFKCPPQNCGVNAAAGSFFQIPTPSARMIVKIALFWWPPLAGQAQALLAPPANSIDVFQNLSIQNWKLNLYTAEQAESGWLIPTGDLVGTLQGGAFANGQIVPVTAAGLNLGLAGFSIDVQGGQDWVCGALLIPNCTGYAVASATGLNVTLRVRYEAQGAEMCGDEWTRITSKLQVQATPTVVFA